MSERIKLNMKQSNFFVKIKNPAADTEAPESNEDFVQKQLQTQFQLGYNKGYEAATDELEKTYSEKLLSRLKDIHNVAAALEHKILEHEEYYESVIIQLSLMVAEKIIKREITDKTIIDEVMKESLKKIIGANNVIVKINPSDLSEMSSEAGQLMNDSAFTKIKFEPDDRIEQGGCFIESEIGNVDARISSQINELKKNLDAVSFHGTKE
ncbi:MAG: FliH/SctL family protein [Ignavibacteriaceae bacterium]